MAQQIINYLKLSVNDFYSKSVTVQQCKNIKKLMKTFVTLK